jgi:putative MATE family efflux protein
LNTSKEQKRVSAPTLRDWTQGSIPGNLVLLSWPMVVMEGLFVTSQVVDMIWIGRLGPSAIAGAGIASIIIMMIMSMDFGLIIGVRAMVARFIGARDQAQADHVAAQAILLGIVWGGLMMTIGILSGRHIMDLMGVEPEVIEEGMSYLRVMFYGWIAQDLMVMTLFSIQSAGDTVRPMLIEGGARIIHVTLDPLLVLGVGVFPQLGVSGAALSNVISQVFGACVGLWLLFSGRSRLKVHTADFKPDIDIIRRIFRIGIPALVMNTQRSIGQFILTALIAPFGTAAVAAHSLAARVEMFVFLPAYGLGNGAGVLVGQNLGAAQPKRAEHSVWVAVGIIQVLMVLVCVALLLWPEQIMHVFSSDAELIATGGTFIRVAVAGFFFLGVASILQSAIASAGDTVPNMIISLAMLWAIELPLALLLPRWFGIGVLGIRWAIATGAIFSGVVYLIYFQTGRWKHKTV